MDGGSDRGVTLLPGLTLPERYQPLRRIAKGGMATVWCARDRTLDRNVAIKLLAAPYAHDQLAGRRFTREARAAARLSGHANVVTIYDVGRAMPSDEVPLGRPFIVMEYLAGGTVADALRLGELDQPMVLEWLREAAGALDYAHRRGVIHRDVKLSNFLLDRHRVLHVADFGIAQLGTEETLTSSGQVFGTAAYLAPERALGLAATESSDRYALAVAAFELLVGERPFRAEHFAAQARQHVEDPPPSASHRNPALPRALDAVLARGMAKAQEERYRTAGELVEAIEQALTRARAGRLPPPKVVSPPPAVTVYGGRGRSRIAAVTALSAALLAVVLAAGAAILPSSAHPALVAHVHAVHAQHRAKPSSREPLPARDPGRSHHKAAAHTSPPASTTTTTPAPPPPTGAATLAAQGHQLMLGGNYHGAIQVLRQAVATAPRSSLTYAYALYDLGRSLRLAGDPRAAVPILWRRLQIPDQTDTVRAELTLALEALGQHQSSNPPSGAAPPSGGGSPASDGGPLASTPHGHDHGPPSGPGDSQGD
jgi:serine/threonine-protein kinase